MHRLLQRAARSATAASARHTQLSSVRSVMTMRPTTAAATCTLSSSAPAAMPAAAAHFSSSSSSSSVGIVAPVSSSSSLPLVAPAFGTQKRSDARFVYIKGVKSDGRSKRFYANVKLEEVETTRGREVGIMLDGRFIVTPHDHILTCPTPQAALAVAFEWDSQGDFIRPVSMPMTNIAVTALDQAFDDRARFLTHFNSAIQTDSVFLRVSSPSGLVQQQRRHWDPLLQWFRERYDCNLATTLEIETPQQHAASLQIQRDLLASLTGWQLAALDALTTVTKSFVISWALLAERLTIPQAFEAARLEENFQMRQYGKVEGVYGHGIDMEFTRMSIAAAKTFSNMCSSPTDVQPNLQPFKTALPASTSEQ